MRIPSERARTLSGLNVTIPNDFTGERNALLIAFERAHLVLFPAWHAALREALAADPELGFYGIALIGPVPAWQQRLTAWALRLEITDVYSRQHIALVPEDARGWARRAGIPGIDSPLLVICDRDGDIHSAADGPPRAVTAQAAARALLM